MKTFTTKTEDRALVEKILKESNTPLRVDVIATRSKLSMTDVRRCIGVLRVAKKVYNAGTQNLPAYMLSANRPKPIDRPERVTNSKSVGLLVANEMHSDRPGAMDYQKINSLSMGKTVPFWAASVSS